MKLGIPYFIVFHFSKTFLPSESQIHEMTLYIVDKRNLCDCPRIQNNLTFNMFTVSCVGTEVFLRAFSQTITWQRSIKIEVILWNGDSHILAEATGYFMLLVQNKNVIFFFWFLDWCDSNECFMFQSSNYGIWDIPQNWPRVKSHV